MTHREGNELELAVVLRPEVGMKDVSGVPYVVALGACEGFDVLGIGGVGIGWPSDVVCERGLIAPVRASAGYAEGIFVVASLELDLGGLGRGEGAGEAQAETPSEQAVIDALAGSVISRVNLWADDVRAGRAVAGPLGPVLSEYFDRVLLMGKPVEVVYPNGNVALRGTLAGVDIWGRATITNEFGRELEISPEQASIRAAENG